MNQVTGKVDENQDKLINVHLGLDSYDYFDKFTVISKNMEVKKFLERKIALATKPEEKDSLEKQIKQINDSNAKELEKITVWK